MSLFLSLSSPPTDASGHFTPALALARLTVASLFASPGVAWPAVVRFGGAGDDTVAFEVTVRTTDGPWRLPGGPLPVDGPDPGAGDGAWAAVVDDPVARHRLLWRASDHARPAAWHRLHASVHGAWRATTADGRRSWWRLQWLPHAGAAGVSLPEARERRAGDPGGDARRFGQAIADGLRPAWDLALQVVGDAEIAALGLSPEDPDGWLPEEWVPVQRIGTLVLDRTGPGVEAGVDARARGLPGLDPVAVAAPGAAAAAERAALLWRSLSARERRHLAQALRIALAATAPAALHAPVVGALAAVDPALAAAVGGPLGVRTPTSAAGPAAPPAAAAQTPLRVEVSPALSLQGRDAIGDPVAGSRVAVLLGDGVDTRALRPLWAALVRHGVRVDTVGPRLGAVRPGAGEAITVDGLLEAGTPLAWDALVLPAGDDALAALCADGRVMQWIRTAWRHGRPLVALGGWALTDAAGVPRRLDDGRPDPGLLVVPHPRDDADDAAAGGSAPGVDELLAALAAGPVDAREHEPPLV